MKRRLLTLLLTMIFCVTSVAPGFAMDADDIGGAVPSAAVEQMSATDKISAMEKMLYGTEQAGALVGRMDSLEDDVYGTVTSDAILDRVDNLYDYLKGAPNSNEAGFLTKLTLLNGSLMKACPAARLKTVLKQ